MATMATHHAASAAYTGAAKAAFRGGRRGWLTAAFNLGAIVVAFGSANFIASTLFERHAELTDVAVASETKGDLWAAEGMPEAAPVLADLARHARTLVAPSLDLMLFEEPGAFAAAFAPEAAWPPSSGFSSTADRQPSTPPVVAEPGPAPADEPTLLAYLPQPIAGAVERVAPEPAMVAIDELTAPAEPLVAAVATAAPLNILPPLGSGHDGPAAGNRGTSTAATQPVGAAVRSASATSGTLVRSATTTLSTTTRSVTGAVRSLLN